MPSPKIKPDELIKPGGERPGGETPIPREDNKPEPYDAEVFHDNHQRYIFKQELGRGTYGIVYLYHHEKDPSLKIALKVARVGNRFSVASINSESNYHKKISNFFGLKKFVPKFLRQTYFDKTPVIMSEFIDQSIQEYILTINQAKSPLGIVGIILQMFDAIHMLHSEAKFLHKDIKPDNFRIQGH